ncbi:MAG: UPF0182 family protein, partial [Desulfovibrionales bacterium]
MGHPFGPGEPGHQRPQIRLEDLDFSKLSRYVRFGIFALILILLWSAIRWGQSFYIDWLWFSSVGHETVLWKIVSTRVVLYLLAAVLFLALAVPNILGAVRATGRIRFHRAGNISPNIYWGARRLLTIVALVIVGLMALFMASSPAAQWETVLRYLNQVPFGTTDPIFNRDYSFYVFTLPALEFLRSWLMGSIVLI